MTQRERNNADVTIINRWEEKKEEEGGAGK